MRDTTERPDVNAGTVKLAGTDYRRLSKYILIDVRQQKNSKAINPAGDGLTPDVMQPLYIGYS